VLIQKKYFAELLIAPQVLLHVIKNQLEFLIISIFVVVIDRAFNSLLEFPWE
jgi:hypothetical protein